MRKPELSDLDLRRLAERAIFFGHQSVGDNILAGVRELAAGHPGLGPKLVESADPAVASKGTWVHARLGRNGDPAGKIADFGRQLDLGFGARVDVAFMKLCYIDFAADTDGPALFATYERAMRALAQKYPAVTFVHVTVPLTTVATGVRATLKRVLGRPVWGEGENARRYEYNQLLRRRLGAAPLFDLAEIEASDPRGEQAPAFANGRRFQALLPQLASDTGHLNERGRAAVAAELVKLIANLPPTPSP